MTTKLTNSILSPFVPNDEEINPIQLSDKIVEYYNSHLGIKQEKSYESFLYEVMGYLHKDFIGTVHDIMENSLYEWGASVFEKNRIARKEALNKVTFKPVAIKGLDFCKVCKGDEFTYWQAQTRSNDEQTTTFKRCIKCNFT